MTLRSFWNRSATNRIWLLLGIVMGLAVRAPSPLDAALPEARLSAIFPLGGAPGTEVELVCVGTDLDEAKQLLFSHPGIRGELRTRPPEPYEDGPQTVPGQFKVSIAEDVPPGIYEVRSVGFFGASNPRLFAVWPESSVREGEPNDTADQAQLLKIPCVVEGRSDRATDVDVFTVELRLGQQIVVDCVAQQLDSRMDATLVLHDPSGREVARGRSLRGRDACIAYTASVEGTHRLVVNDFVYEGGEEYPYRLRVSMRPHVEFVVPPVVVPGKISRHELFGHHLPGGTPCSEFPSKGSPWESCEVEIFMPAQGLIDPSRQCLLRRPGDLLAEAFAYRLKTPRGFSNAVWLGVVDSPPVAEMEPNDSVEAAQVIEPPGYWHGRFSSSRDVDWFVFEARAGQAYWMEVTSHRWGKASDPFLSVKRIMGNKDGQLRLRNVAAADDIALETGNRVFPIESRDARLRFEAPESGRYAIHLRNQSAQDDPGLTYVLSVLPEQPDFRLFAHPRFQDSTDQNAPAELRQLHLRRGSTVAITVDVDRRHGFQGEISVNVQGLPPGVRSDAIIIPPGGNSGMLVLECGNNAPAATANLRIQGTARIGNGTVTHEAKYGTLVFPARPNDRNAPRPVVRVCSGLELTVSDAEASPTRINLDGDGKETFRVVRHGTLEIPVSLERPEGHEAEVNFTAVGLPPAIEAQPLKVSGKEATGKLTLTAKDNSPSGHFSFHVMASGNFPYRRNLAAAQRGETRHKKLTETVSRWEAEEKSKTKQAQEVSAALEKHRANHAEAAQRENSLRNAAQVLRDRARESADEHETAQQALQVAMARAEAAEKQAQAAQAAAAEANDAQAQAQQVLEAIAGEVKSREEQLNKVETETTRLKQDLEAARKALEQLAKTAQQAKEAATSRDVPLVVHSPTARLHVLPTPWKLTGIPPVIELWPGDKVRIPFAVERIASTDQPFTLHLQLPDEAGPITSEAITVDPDMDESELIIQLGSDPSEEEFPVKLVIEGKFRGQPVKDAHDILLIVHASESTSNSP